VDLERERLRQMELCSGGERRGKKKGRIKKRRSAGWACIKLSWRDRVTLKHVARLNLARRLVGHAEACGTTI